MNFALRRYSDDDQWSSSINTTNELSRSVARPVVLARPQLSAPTFVHNSKWARATIDRLVALASLKENWDQRGSAAPRADVLSFAWTILAQIMPSDGKAPVIVPLGNGGVQIEWNAPHVELEIEVTRPFEVSAFLFEDGRDDEEIATDTLDELTRLIALHFRS
jgi:hypothetical protein